MVYTENIIALKETHEALHREVETLKAENQRLRRNVDDLSDTVKRYDVVERVLVILISKCANVNISLIKDWVM